MVVDGVVVPVGDASAEGAVEGGGDNLDAGLDESAGHQALLAPGVAAVAVAEAGVFLVEVEGAGGLGAGQEADGLGLESVHRLESAGGVDLAAEVIERASQLEAAVEAFDLGVGQADVGHAEAGGTRIAGDGEGLIRRAEVGGPGDHEAVVAGDRIDADVVGDRAGGVGAGAEVVGDGHEVGADRLRLVARVGVAGEDLERASGVAAAGVGHRAEHGEAVGERGEAGNQLGEVEAGGLRRDRGERAAELGGGVGLRVERVEVAATAAEPDDDDGRALPRPFPRRPPLSRRGRAEAEQGRQGERPQAGQAGAEELAAGGGGGHGGSSSWRKVRRVFDDTPLVLGGCVVEDATHPTKDE